MAVKGEVQFPSLWRYSSFSVKLPGQKDDSLLMAFPWLVYLITAHRGGLNCPRTEALLHLPGNVGTPGKSQDFLANLATFCPAHRGQQPFSTSCCHKEYKLSCQAWLFREAQVQILLWNLQIFKCWELHPLKTIATTKPLCRLSKRPWEQLQDRCQATIAVSLLLKRFVSWMILFGQHVFKQASLTRQMFYPRRSLLTRNSPWAWSVCFVLLQRAIWPCFLSKGRHSWKV